MTKDGKKRHGIGKKRWQHINTAVFLTVVILVCATTVWLRSTLSSSEKTVNDLVEFYLEEIAERNSGAITSELEKKSRQMERAMTVLRQDDLRTIVQADINAKQLDMFIDTVDVVNEDVICDRLRLNQILLNLLSNAMKFTQPGGTVSLRIIQTPAAPEALPSTSSE